MARGRTVHRWPVVLGAALLLVAGLALLGRALHRPRNDRDWSLDQKVLAFADLDGDRVTVHHIRNFTYRSEADYTPAYYDRTFELSKLKKIWYVVEPFTSF